jgi:hypothetical protein
MIGAKTYKALRSMERISGQEVAYSYAHVCHEVGERVSDGKDGQADDSVRQPENKAESLRISIFQNYFVDNVGHEPAER